MEFSIGTQFSREFNSEEKLLIIKNLNDNFNGFFNEKEYCSDIKKIYIGIICVSKGFEPFFMPRPLKVLKKDLAISYEIKIDFDIIYNSNIEEKMNNIYSELLSQSKEIINSIKIIKFDKDSFLNDLEEFVKIYYSI